MSPSSCPPTVSPSGGSSANHNHEAVSSNNRSFSSPEAHRPGSANNDPMISPHHLAPHPQSFFPPQQPPMATIRPPTPSSPPGGAGSNLKTAKNNNGSILERALASTIKQENPQLSVSSSGPTPSITMSACIDTPVGINGVHIGGPMDHWHPQQPQGGHYLGEEMNPFMKHEAEMAGNLQYDLNYMAAAAAAAGGGGPNNGGVDGSDPGNNGLGGPQGLGGQGPHHLSGVNRSSGDPGGPHHHHVHHNVHHEDHLHSPSQYNMAAQQPPWVR